MPIVARDEPYLYTVAMTYEDIDKKIDAAADLRKQRKLDEEAIATLTQELSAAERISDQIEPEIERMRMLAEEKLAELTKLMPATLKDKLGLTEELKPREIVAMLQKINAVKGLEYELGKLKRELSEAGGEFDAAREERIKVILQGITALVGAVAVTFGVLELGAFFFGQPFRYRGENEVHWPFATYEVQAKVIELTLEVAKLVAKWGVAPVALITAFRTLSRTVTVRDKRAAKAVAEEKVIASTKAVADANQDSVIAFNDAIQNLGLDRDTIQQLRYLAAGVSQFNTQVRTLQEKFGEAMSKEIETAAKIVEIKARQEQ